MFTIGFFLEGSNYFIWNIFPNLSLFRNYLKQKKINQNQFLVSIYPAINIFRTRTLHKKSRLTEDVALTSSEIIMVTLEIRTACIHKFLAELLKILYLIIKYSFLFLLKKPGQHALLNLKSGQQVNFFTKSIDNKCATSIQNPTYPLAIFSVKWERLETSVRRYKKKLYFWIF